MALLVAIRLRGKSGEITTVLDVQYNTRRHLPLNNIEGTCVIPVLYGTCRPNVSSRCPQPTARVAKVSAHTLETGI